MQSLDKYPPLLLWLLRPSDTDMRLHKKMYPMNPKPYQSHYIDVISSLCNRCHMMHFRLHLVYMQLYNRMYSMKTKTPMRYLLNYMYVYVSQYLYQQYSFVNHFLLS